MAVAWTDITNAQVAAGAALTTALVTSLRDNPEGIAQRATGAPKIFGVAYDYQEFTANGTWTKPSNAETGDRVIVQIVGGGGSGARSAGADGGGGGGGGYYKIFEDIDDFSATESVVVGAGAAGGTGSGSAGGDSLFGTHSTADSGVTAPVSSVAATAEGGTGGIASGADGVGGNVYEIYTDTGATNSIHELDSSDAHIYRGGNGTGTSGYASIYGGGGGGGTSTGGDTSLGGLSAHAGRGGMGTSFTGDVANFVIDGAFPGGGGGGVDTGLTGDTVGGAGGDGVVRVWCIKES